MPNRKFLKTIEKNNNMWYNNYIFQKIGDALMNKEKFLECGKIINTHGIKGTVKAESWCDSPYILAELERVFTEENGRAKEGCSEGRGAQEGAEKRDTASTECDQVPLAYVYSPNQKFCMLYSAEDVLKHGTLFENLYKPMEVYGRE
jgi:hypothetical protein